MTSVELAKSLQIKLYTLVEVEKSGGKMKQEFVEQQPEDIITIIYTRYIYVLTSDPYA